jgi:hypothetical protein
VIEKGSRIDDFVFEKMRNVESRLQAKPEGVREKVDLMG